MICQLCKVREADKKNTHYLTDAIIRLCLNQDGSKDREKGFYFDVSNDSDSINFNFQRKTSIEKIEESLRRPISEVEIEKAKYNPCSVDNVFCSECEVIFSEIENKFIPNILPRFRDKPLSDIDEIDIPEVKDLRLFFYLQLWRTHICEKEFQLKESVAEDMRQIILNRNSAELSQIKKYPLSITYMETLGDKIEYTRNLVGSMTGYNPYIILLNDFIIQFFDSESDIVCIELLGINNKESFHEYVNYSENMFHIKIIHDEDRKNNMTMYYENKKKCFIITIISEFKDCWQSTFGNQPSKDIVKEYYDKISEGEFHILKYSKERINKIKSDFIYEKI